MSKCFKIWRARSLLNEHVTLRGAHVSEMFNQTLDKRIKELKSMLSAHLKDTP